MFNDTFSVKICHCHKDIPVDITFSFQLIVVLGPGCWTRKSLSIIGIP